MKNVLKLMGMVVVFGVGMDSYHTLRGVYTMTHIVLRTIRTDSVQELLMDFQWLVNQCPNNKKLIIDNL